MTNKRNIPQRVKAVKPLVIGLNIRVQIQTRRHKAEQICKKVNQTAKLLQNDKHPPATI